MAGIHRVFDMLLDSWGVLRFLDGHGRTGSWLLLEESQIGGVAKAPVALPSCGLFEQTESLELLDQFAGGDERHLHLLLYQFHIHQGSLEEEVQQPNPVHLQTPFLGERAVPFP